LIQRFIKERHVFSVLQKRRLLAVGEIRIGKYRTFRICKKAHLIGDIDASDGSETRTLQMVTDFLVQELDKVRNAGDSEVTVLLRNSNESVPTPSTQVKDIPCKGYKLVDKKNQPCTEKTDNLLIWQSKASQLVFVDHLIFSPIFKRRHPVEILENRRERERERSKKQMTNPKRIRTEDDDLEVSSTED